MEIVKVFIIFSLVSRVKNFQLESELFESGQEQCWNKSDKCYIQGELWFESGRTFPFRRNCNNSESEYEASADNNKISELQYADESRNLFLKHHENIQGISLNGCYSNSHTFGLEFIPNYVNFIEVNLENFQTKEMSPVMFVNRSKTIKRITFRNNSVERILKNSFEKLESIEYMSFEENGLKNINTKAFQSLLALKVIILLERDLVIEDSYNLFSDTTLKVLILTVKTINRRVLTHLPKTIEMLNVTQSGFIENDVLLINPLHLKEVHITFNDIGTFTVMDKKTLRFLNLSSNNLIDLILYNCTGLKYLDLSHNLLHHLRSESFFEMESLEEFYLQENRLKVLSMDIFKRAESTLKFIDLSNNLLRVILMKSKFTPNAELNVEISKNPWNCKWLLDLSEKRPEQYKIFRYEKNYRRINLNGLECLPYPNVTSLGERTTNSPVAWNLTGYSYTPPPETKKFQRTEAMIVVLFLFIGVGFLSFILYLWIKCQKMFHLSFYRSLPRKRCSPADGGFDVVRQMPGVSTYETHLQCVESNQNLKRNALSKNEDSSDAVKVCNKLEGGGNCVQS